jgi:predicted RNA-binding Zn-ribbon protein involved in translation (DUF1610 family)
MDAKRPDEHASLCPHCGMEAQWFFLDPENRQVEIACPNCGRYEMAREEFDRVMVENPGLDEPEG